MGECEESKASRIFNRLIMDYANMYSQIANGTDSQRSTEELIGGAKIKALVRASFKKKIDEIRLTE